MFARGNNTAFAYRSQNSQKTLLINSDVEILSDGWLDPLLDANCTIAGYEKMKDSEMPEGWCYLIDTKAYLVHGLNERFPFWGCVPRLTNKVLEFGGTMKTVTEYGHLIKHYGKKSWPAGFFPK